MHSLSNTLVAIAVGAVFIALLFGIYSLFRGGDFGRTYSNKLMRLRVTLQFVAIVVILAALYFTGR